MTPSHYEGKVEAIEIIEHVLSKLSSAGIGAKHLVCLSHAMKYALRCGRKGDWESDAHKCADWLCRAMTDEWLHERGEYSLERVISSNDLRYIKESGK